MAERAAPLEAPSDLEEIRRLGRSARESFRREFGAAPARLFQAPGRINLIGEHTDYTGGLVMPAAIDRRCVVAARENGLGRIRLRTLADEPPAEARLDALRPTGLWADYVLGVAKILQDEGVEVRGCDLVVASEVPVGAGVSSSAALEVASAHALLGLAGASPVTGERIALWTQAAENRFVGVPCGIMDQYASENGREGAALLLDCRTLAAEAIPAPGSARFLLVDSQVRHALVDGGYAARRADCEAAAAKLGLPSLRDAMDLDPAELDRRLEPRVARRARHVITENRRVLDAAKAIRAADLPALGRLMNASHESLARDMEVSTPELDRLQRILVGTGGVYGARMMGGGFGGSVLALVEAGRAEEALAGAQDGYGRELGRRPDGMICRLVAGAGEVEL